LDYRGHNLRFYLFKHRRQYNEHMHDEQ